MRTEQIERALRGKRVLITGAARGIGAATARRLTERGARVTVAGIETDQLAALATDIGAPWFECDVTLREDVDAAVEAAVDDLGGLDIVIANAGVAAQLPIVGGDHEIFERTIAVNLLGAYYTLRAAGPHVSHSDGYALAIASLAAAVHVPLMSAYCASKAGVEALGNALRSELRPSGARVGVAYFAELDTDMTSRGFATKAAERVAHRGGPFTRVMPLPKAIDLVEQGIARRSRHICAPRWVGAALPARAIVQRVVEAGVRPGLAEVLEIARSERPPLTTVQPDKS
jgi:NAD(P)-dependent dehydrogenase (short-subunit alcohol dehydrogenase family)